MLPCNAQQLVLHGHSVSVLANLESSALELELVRDFSFLVRVHTETMAGDNNHSAKRRKGVDGVTIKHYKPSQDEVTPVLGQFPV